MKEIENAKDDLLREALRGGNQICKVKNEHNSFVKARRGYSHPEAIRTLYMQAFEALINEGTAKLILQNKDLELYEVSIADGHITSKEHAKKVLLKALQQNGHLFKIHSKDGEFVQVGSNAYCEIEEERILFLEALYELVRHGEIQLVNDSKELCRFGLGRPQYALSDKTQSERTQIDLPGERKYAA